MKKIEISTYSVILCLCVLVLQWYITFFVGAGPGTGIQFLQWVLDKINQLGRSHVLKDTFERTLIHVLQDKQNTTSSYIFTDGMTNTLRETQ